MNKEKLTNELNDYVKSMNTEFEVVNDDCDLTLNVRCDAVAWFCDYKKHDFVLSATVDDDLSEVVIETDVLKKFYTKAVELLSKFNEKKYTIHVFPNEKGYLHVNHESQTSNEVSYSFGWPEDSYYLVQTQFTKEEINEMKNNSGIRIDWDKAIEEVDG